jgi:threonylcarbamoyladenosine tRNA methylthiotransferase MtaB
MKIVVLTLGCRTNQAESARIEEMLQAFGHQTVAETGNAEICIINTCSVTAKADRQSRQLISRALKTKAEVFVTGCYADLNAARLCENNSAIRVIRNRDKDHLINLIPHLSSTTALSLNTSQRHRPIIKVQDGCDNKCSYCIIPQARGKSSSISPEKVIENVNHYHSLGFDEIVLSGIHLGMYGRDFKDPLNLAELLKLILIRTSVSRIRLSSIEINELSEELIDLLLDKRICKHLHLPLQSGDNSILQKMNRSYSSAEYRKCITYLISRFNKIGIGTDVIVGFPGEDDSHFDRTVQLIEAIDISYLHVFPYSVRPGTRAASMPGQITESVKKARVVRLRELGDYKKAVFIRKNFGFDHEMAVETVVDGAVKGTTSNFIKVHVPSDDSLRPGRLVTVRFTGFESGVVSGIAFTNSKPHNK